MKNQVETFKWIYLSSLEFGFIVDYVCSVCTVHISMLQHSVFWNSAFNLPCSLCIVHIFRRINCKQIDLFCCSNHFEFTDKMHFMLQWHCRFGLFICINIFSIFFFSFYFVQFGDLLRFSIAFRFQLNIVNERVQEVKKNKNSKKKTNTNTHS